MGPSRNALMTRISAKKSQMLPLFRKDEHIKCNGSKITQSRVLLYSDIIANRCTLGDKIQNWSVDFKTGGTWRQAGQ